MKSYLYKLLENEAPQESIQVWDLLGDKTKDEMILKQESWLNPENYCFSPEEMCDIDPDTFELWPCS